jgi:hypothetical protein
MTIGLFRPLTTNGNDRQQMNEAVWPCVFSPAPPSGARDAAFPTEACFRTRCLVEGTSPSPGLAAPGAVVDGEELPGCSFSSWAGLSFEGRAEGQVEPGRPGCRRGAAARPVRDVLPLRAPFPIGDLQPLPPHPPARPAPRPCRIWSAAHRLHCRPPGIPAAAGRACVKRLPRRNVQRPR